MRQVYSTPILWLSRLLLASAAFVAINATSSEFAYSQENITGCPVPGLATRIAPRHTEPQSFTGVLAGAEGQRDLAFDIPAGAHMEIEIVVRRMNRVRGWPWSASILVEEGGNPEAFPVSWDEYPWWKTERLGGVDEVTERARGVTNFAARNNTKAKLSITSAGDDLTYLVRIWPVFYGDAGTRLDSGGRAEEALPIPSGTVVEGNFAYVGIVGGVPLVRSEAGIDFNDLNMRSGDDNLEPVMIDEDYDRSDDDNEDSVLDELSVGPDSPDPTTNQDQSSPRSDLPYVDDSVDLYRLNHVPAGSRISAKLVASEFLRTGHRPPFAAGTPVEFDVEILRPACDEQGHFILLETKDSGDFQYRGIEDEYYTPVAGDYFVRITGYGATKYWFRVDYDSAALAFWMDPPYFEVVEKHLPQEPSIGAPVHMAMRLRNLPDFRATNVTARFQFLDAGSKEELDSATSKDDRCKAGGNGGFICEYGDVEWGGHRDSLFTATLPPDGILWLATWNSAEGAGGETSAYGLVGQDADSRIDDVYVLADQTSKSFGVPSYPYPFNPWAREGLDYRTLFVTGWKLPQELDDTLEFSSSDDAVEYRYIAYPDTTNPLHQAAYQSGWALYREKHGLAPDAKIPDNLDGLIVRANLRRGILPGFQRIKINDTAAPWELQFGGMEAGIRFVHAGEALPIGNAYIPERVEVVVESNVPLPLESVDLVLYEDRVGQPGAHVHKLPAKLAPTGSARKQQFVSPHIVLTRAAESGTPPASANQIVINIDPAQGGPVRLRAEIDPDFRLRKFALPVLPAMADINIIKSPMEEPIAIGLGAQAAAGPQSLFHLALRTAAACQDVSIADWDALDLQNTEADYFWNVVLLTLFDEDIRTESVTIGHHAATLLLREMFIDQLDRTIRHLGFIEVQDDEVLGVLKRMTGHFGDRSFPINRILITAPDGTEIEYGYAVTTSDHALIAEQYGLGAGPSGEAKAFEWRVDATREALQKLKTRTTEIRDEARALDPCDDIEDLVRMTGTGFEVVQASLSPKLRRLVRHPAVSGQPAWSAWEHDSDAHFWNRELGELLVRVKKQEAVARQDTDLLIAATALLSVPVSAGTGGSAAYVALAFSVVDVAATGWLEISEYLRSQRELDFSEKAGIVLGFERNAQAEKEAKAFGEVLFNVGISAYFAGLDGIEAVRAIRSARPVIKGMNVTRSLRERGITTLSDIERRHFATFAMRSRLRELRLGAQNLTDLERRALDEVDAFVKRQAENSSAAISPGPETAPPVIADSRAMNIDLGPGGNPIVRAVDEPVLDNPEAFVAIPRGPPENVNPIQLVADQFAEQAENLTVGPNAHAARGWTAREVGPSLAGHEISFEVGPNDVRTFTVGEFINGGATTAAFTSPVTTQRGSEAVGRLTLDTGGHRAASSDAYGAGVITEIASPNLRLPEIVDTFEVAGTSVAGYPVVRIQFAERIETAEALINRVGELSEAHLAALDNAIRDLNLAGYAWLDMKWDNFGFVMNNGRLQVVIIDTGGIVRVVGSNADIARQIQLLVNGPYLETFPEYPRLVGNPGWRTGVRKTEILDRFGDQVDFGDMPGIDGWGQLGFTPAGGEQLEGFGQRLSGQ